MQGQSTTGLFTVRDLIVLAGFVGAWCACSILRAVADDAV
jgi:hypothetical protein